MLSVQQKLNILLIPGLASDETVFIPQLPCLSVDYAPTIIKIDDFSSLEKIFSSIAKDMTDNTIVIGHSMGGWLAVEIAKHFNKQVIGLVLIATSALGDTVKQKQYREDRLEQTALGNWKTVIKQMADRYVYNHTVYKITFDMFWRNQKHFINQQKLLLTRSCNRFYLQQLICPTLLIIGKHDVTFYDDMITMAQLLPNATLNTVENAGHMVTLEAPTAVNHAIIDWLAHTFKKAN